jgi:hypothetical protein
MDWFDLKNRLKDMDISLKDFSIILGFKYNSLIKWKQTQIPVCAISMLELLEKISVAERGAFIAIKKALHKES